MHARVYYASINVSERMANYIMQWYFSVLRSGRILRAGKYIITRQSTTGMHKDRSHQPFKDFSKSTNTIISN